MAHHSGAVPEESTDQEISRSIHDDAATLVSQLIQEFRQQQRTHTKANVLLAGVTGSGKSSLINSIFDAVLAQVGTGAPVTQHFQRYTFKDRALVLYDAKGLETGDYDIFVQETLDFFKQHSEVRDCDNLIHVVWYVINSAGARFQPFEERLCREVFSFFPIIFILNKKDISNDEDRQTLRRVIEDMHIENCLGIFETIGDSRKHTRAVERCSKCDSEEITIKPKKGVCICDSCNHITELTIESGLESVVKKTVEILPEVVKESFISSQFVSFELKDQRAHQILREHYHEVSSIRTVGTLVSIVAKMLTRISILWDFRQNSPFYSTLIAKDLVGNLSLKEKIMMFLSRNTTYKIETTAIGILWNRCVRKLAKTLLHDFVENDKQVREFEVLWPELLQSAFAELSEQQLDFIAQHIQDDGLEQVLAIEMASYYKVTRSATANTTNSSPVHNTTNQIHTPKASASPTTMTNMSTIVSPLAQAVSPTVYRSLYNSDLHTHNKAPTAPINSITKEIKS